MFTRARRGAAWPLVCCAVLLGARPVSAFEFFDGRLQFHGFYRAEARTIASNFDPGDFRLTQLAHTLNLEIEADIAPDGWGPFNSIGAYTRINARFDCIWTNCGTNSDLYYGNDGAARNLKALFDAGEDDQFQLIKMRARSKTLADGTTGDKSGFLDFGTSEPVQPSNHKLTAFFYTPVFQPLFDVGGGNTLATLEPIKDNVALTSTVAIEGGFERSNFVLGPYNRNSLVDSLATLNTVESLALPLPTRPQIPVPRPFALPRNQPKIIQGLWAPHVAVRNEISDITAREGSRGGAFNYSSRELKWNHGEGQDEKELKEFYVDLEMFDGRFFLRAGYQTIVWGKTELFRNQDQWNPQDVGLASLPSLEESRLSQWAFRGIWSFYDVGPLEDVRLELATILDDFQPIDAGTCGEPYSPWLVCAGSFGFYTNGLTGAGLAGAPSPPNPWDDVRGLEIGGRLEWRYHRFSFALSDFYGYSDIPYVDRIAEYSRAVNPRSGKPLDALGNPYKIGDSSLEEQALNLNPMNRSLFEFSCSLSVGVAGTVIPALGDECALTVFNSSTPIAPNPLGGADITAADAFAQALAGTAFGGLVIGGAAGFPSLTVIPLIGLNMDPNDGPPPVPIQVGASLACADQTLRFIFGGGANPLLCLSEVTTDQQEALLGCGPFYGTNCDIEGFDLYNAEASVIFQALPMFEPGGPIGTRYVRGELWQLPGSRGPGEPGYDPDIDGCVGPLPRSLDPRQLCANSKELLDPNTGLRFRSEMQALSSNLVSLLVAFGVNSDPDGDCSLDGDPLDCDFVRGIFGLTRIGRPDLRAGGNGRFGRRDFVWAGGGPAVLRFAKRNVLGFSMDFAEDWSKTNWSIEATWVANDAVGDTDRPSNFRRTDAYNLTVSFDRPTFVNFLNVNRTLLFNTQIFFRYVPGEEFQTLGTFTIFTGYFQDRLLVQTTLVHDVQSVSGGMIFNMTYRFNSNFSATFGVVGFYGRPREQQDALFPIALGENSTNEKRRTNFNGLSILRNQDEISLSLRYTF